VLAVVEGEGGAGKTRVVSDVVLRAGIGAGSTVLVGSCVPYGEANRWWPLASALGGALRIDQSSTTPERARASLLEVMPGLTGRRGDEADALIDGLLHLFGLSSPLDAIDPARARQEVTLAVLAVLQGLVARGPLTLVVADVHWADPIVLEVLSLALVRLANHPLAVVTTTRPELTAPWPPAGLRTGSLVLRLGPLDREASGALVRSLLGEDVDGSVVDDLFQRSGGNPLFLEELASLVAGGDDKASLPDSLRALVSARLDQLPPDQRAMLDNAAVLGSSGPWAALVVFGEALGQPVGRNVLDGLVEAGLLDVDGDRWRFRSESVRDVSYGTITKGDRAARHAGVAKALEMRKGLPGHLEEVAHHWASAAELAAGLGALREVPANVAVRAVDALVAAAEQALEQLFASRAEELADRALPLVPAGDAERERVVLLLRAEARTEQRHVTEAQDDLDRVMANARASGDESVEAKALRVSGELHRQLGRYDRARDDLDRAAVLLRSLGDVPALAEAELAAGMNGIFSGAFAEAEAHLQEAERLFSELGDRRGRAWVDQHRAWVSFVQGDVEEADRRLQRAAAAMAELGDRGGLAWVMGLQAYVRFFQGRFEDATRLCDEVEEAAAERGDRWAGGMMTTLRASLTLWSGQAGTASRLAGDAAATFRSLRDRFGEAQALTVAARSLVVQGLGSEAARTAEAAMAVVTGMGEASMVDLVAAAVDLYRGELRRAATLSRRAIDESGSRGFAREAEVIHGLAQLLLGEGDDALATLEAAMAHRPGHPACVAALALAQAAEHRPAEALATLAADGPMAGTYLDRVLGSVASGLAHARLGQDADAVAAIARAQDTADDTDDALAGVVVRLAGAAVFDVLGLTEAAAMAAADADARLDLLDVDLSGWRRLFRRAADGVGGPTMTEVGA
jgi:tetratricopeptide (TPR) repeat protein